MTTSLSQRLFLLLQYSVIITLLIVFRVAGVSIICLGIISQVASRSTNERPTDPHDPRLSAPHFNMPRRQHITLLMILGVSAFLGIFLVSFFRGIPEGARSADFIPSYAEPISGSVDEGLLHTEAKAPKLENATLKYVSLTVLSPWKILTVF